jgi:hypothetical protein
MELGTLFPLLFLLSCALMIFVMRGHGHEGHGTQALQPVGDEREKPEAKERTR